MRRYTIQPRINWREKVESIGLSYHTIDGEIYWDESAYYVFSLDQINSIEQATNELYDRYIDAAEYVIEHNLFQKIGIPEDFVPLIKQSWYNDEKAMYGRFDFVYDGYNQPKLLEFNADTPTALLEASVAQWYWLKECFPQKDQFNLIHERLLDFWRRESNFQTIHFSCIHDHEEDFGNTSYIRDVAMQAGHSTEQVFIEDIGWNHDQNKFVDLSNRPIKTIFKLYPWEWLMRENFATQLKNYPWRVIEPAWKAILSNKALLPILWQLFPNHPNLLPSFFENKFTDNYVKKPYFSREGSNITIVKNGHSTKTEGLYGNEGFIFQQYQPLMKFGNNYTSIGSWIIDGYASGIGIREDTSEITMNSSRFVPHIFEE